MNKSANRKVTSSATSTTDSTKRTRSTDASKTRKTESRRDNRPSVSEMTNTHADKSTGRESPIRADEKVSASTPPNVAKRGAAKGDDDAMSQPQPSTFATGDLKVLWSQQLSAARLAWTKLTEEELQRVEGQVHRLIDLIQDRYEVTRDEAEKQVKRFYGRLASTLPSADELQGNWKQQVGTAKIIWGKLTEDELLKTEGHAMRLAGLIQTRYAIAREEAERQVKIFFENHKC